MKTRLARPSTPTPSHEDEAWVWDIRVNAFHRQGVKVVARDVVDAITKAMVRRKEFGLNRDAEYVTIICHRIGRYEKDGEVQSNG